MPLTTTDVKVLAIVSPAIAVLITAGRLWLRARNRNFAIDDGCVSLSMVALLAFGVGTYISLTGLGTSVGLYYALTQLYYLALWSARLSILFSLIQPSSGIAARRVIYALALVLTSCWIFLFAQVFYVCERAASWKDSIDPKCPLGSGVAKAQIITDVAVNAVLILLPVILLWRSETTRTQRVHYLLVVAAGTVATAASLVHGYFILQVGGLKELVTAILELSLTLVVANAAVIGSAIWRCVRRPKLAERWEMCRTPSFQGLSPTYSTDTIRTIHLSPLSGTQVSYGGKTPFRRSPSPALWGQDGSGIHITEEKVSVLHFPTTAVIKGSV